MPHLLIGRHREHLEGGERTEHTKQRLRLHAAHFSKVG
jgi:hypothetical protein